MSSNANKMRKLSLVGDRRSESWESFLQPIRVPEAAAPLNLTASSQIGGILVQWSQSKNADGYRLLRTDNGDFSQNVTIIPLKDFRNTTYFDKISGPPATKYYRVESTSGSFSDPQSIIGKATNTASAKTLGDIAPVNAGSTPTASNLCTQSGTSTTINIAASTYKFGSQTISYNSGSVNPGSYGTYYVFADDPTYGGGAITYQASTLNSDVTAKDGRVYFGKLTTAGGGGGSSGGTGGGGPCFSGNTRLIARRGDRPVNLRFDELLPGDELLTLRSWHKVARVITHNFSDRMLNMGGDEFVTPDHRIWHDSTWTPASDKFLVSKFFIGKVYNATIETEEDEARNYTLVNGVIAHNVLK